MCGWHRGRSLTLAAWPPLLLPSQYGAAGRLSTLAPLTALETRLTMVRAPGAGLTSTSVSVHLAAPVLCLCAGDDAADRRESGLALSAVIAARESSRQAGEGEGAGAGEGAGVGGLGCQRWWWCSSHLARGPPGRARWTHGGGHHLAHGDSAPGGTQAAASTARIRRRRRTQRLTHCT